MAQGTELRLRPITHAEGGPTLPPALRVDPKGECCCLCLSSASHPCCARPACLQNIWPLGTQPCASPPRCPAAAEGCKRRIRPALTAAHMTQMVLPQVCRDFGCADPGCARHLPCFTVPATCHPPLNFLPASERSPNLCPARRPLRAARQLHRHHLWRPGDAVDGAVRLHRRLARRPRWLYAHCHHGFHLLPQPHSGGGHRVHRGAGGAQAAVTAGWWGGGAVHVLGGGPGRLLPACPPSLPCLAVCALLGLPPHRLTLLHAPTPPHR